MTQSAVSRGRHLSIHTLCTTFTLCTSTSSLSEGRVVESPSFLRLPMAASQLLTEIWSIGIPKKVCGRVWGREAGARRGGSSQVSAEGSCARRLVLVLGGWP